MTSSHFITIYFDYNIANFYEVIMSRGYIFRQQKELYEQSFQKLSSFRDLEKKVSPPVTIIKQMLLINEIAQKHAVDGNWTESAFIEIMNILALTKPIHSCCNQVIHTRLPKCLKNFNTSTFSNHHPVTATFIFHIFGNKVVNSYYRCKIL